MRIWVSGPRMFGGMIRPGVSWNALELASRRRPAARVGGYVYVIEGAHGHQKIGSSNDPDQRRRELQTGSPISLVIKHAAFVGERAMEVERLAHRILDTVRLPGEWFDVTPETATAAIYAAAAKLGVALNEAPEDDIVGDYVRRWRRFHQIKWTTFAVGMVLMLIAIHYLTTPR